MAGIGDLFTSAIGPAFDGLAKVIDQFHMSPEEKAQAQQAITEAAQKAKDSAQDYEVQLNTIAGQNIRADAESGDKFTQRARPWFMYIVELILAFNYIGVPAYQMVTGKVLTPVALPGDLLTLFGVCVTGYVFARSAEKVTSLPGDSQINVLGMKIGNKS